MDLVLASTSPYRRALLERLRLPFRVVAPEADESPRDGEPAAALAERLARDKAHAVAKRFPEAVVIGADQVASVGETLIGKPGNREHAQAQLRTLSAKTVVFHTALCIVRLSDNREFQARDETTVRFRRLTDTEIARYVELEQPYDCAGSAKSEALGIALLESIDSSDPTALVGLPLIAVCQGLRPFGLSPLA